MLYNMLSVRLSDGHVVSWMKLESRWDYVVEQAFKGELVTLPHNLHVTFSYILSLPDHVSKSMYFRGFIEC